MVGIIPGSSRGFTWTRLLLVSALLMGMVPLDASAAQGDKQYKAGRKAEIRKNYDEALRLYDEAVGLNPTNPQFLLGQSRVRFQAGVAHVDKGHKLQAQGKLQEALAEFQRATEIDPSNPSATQEVLRTRLLMQQPAPLAPAPPAGQSNATPRDPASTLDPRVLDAQGPAELKAISTTPINLRMTNESKVIFETIGKLAGINVLFDPDFVSKRITVELNAVALEDALNQTALLTRTFWKDRKSVV